MEPIDLLKNQLNEYQKALHKSFESFEAGIYSKELHEKHKSNLEPKIFKYKQAIQILENWMD